MRAFFLGFLFFGFLSKSLSFLGFVITGASGHGTVVPSKNRVNARDG